MSPDYRTAKAIQDLRLQGVQDAGQPASTNLDHQSLFELADLGIESRLHRRRDTYRDRPTHHWLRPHPLSQ